MSTYKELNKSDIAERYKILSLSVSSEERDREMRDVPYALRACYLLEYKMLGDPPRIDFASKLWRPLVRSDCCHHCREDLFLGRWTRSEQQCCRGAPTNKDTCSIDTKARAGRTNPYVCHKFSNDTSSHKFSNDTSSRNLTTFFAFTTTGGYCAHTTDEK